MTEATTVEDLLKLVRERNVDVNQIEKLLDSKDKKNERAREYMKQWYAQHPDKTKAIRHLYYKKRMAEDPTYYARNASQSYHKRAAVKINCPCGSTITRPNAPAHTRTAKHTKYMEANPDTVLPW
jgi:hypothetical protein